MGTRNLTAVMFNGEYKIAQYGQWDGYPSGQGLTILSFLSVQGNIDKLKESLSKIRFLDEQGMDKDFIESYNKNAPEWSNEPDNRTPDQKRWFSVYASRDIGGDILNNVSNSVDDEIILTDSIGFAGNSLFCEYAYVIDLDSEVLEIYEGFNKEPISDGRFNSNDENLERSNNKDYEPVKLIKTYSIESLPSEDQFLSDLEGDEDE